jgi:dipeptidase
LKLLRAPLSLLSPVLALVLSPGADACTNLLVTRGASADGSVHITYTCDGEFHPRLRLEPAADHAPGDSLEIVDWSGRSLGWIAEIPHTYAVVRLMNEHQLVIAETTFDGRKELEDPEGLLHYWDLMQLALKRSRTAREAIAVIASLVEEYGYRSTGESFSIGDPTEAWILEMIGRGPGGRGAVWVAVRIPEGMISCHANRARIGSFPLDDPENCVYSPDVISFAVERGYYDPASRKPFRFDDVYCPATPKSLRYTATRVWSLFRRAAPSLELSPDYHRGVPGAEPYPLWIRPDRKLGLADLFDLMRDHYEGTELDMTTGIDAGPFGSPNRARPIGWTIDSLDYSWERPISTPQTGFSFVSESRSWLPNEVGGVLWYGVDDTWFTCYTPLYCSIEEAPRSFTVGSLDRFSWDSTWWVFNLVSNYAQLRYSDMSREVRAVQAEIEGELLATRPAVEKAALDLMRTDPSLAKRFLTGHSVAQGERVVERWRELAEHLITKYNDGYVQTERGKPEEKGYSEEWLRAVLRADSARLRLRPEEPDAAGWKLVD